MQAINDIKPIEVDAIGYRLVNSKFPPIPIFDDVADPADFDDLYEIQSLTNPRLQNEIGNLNLLPRSEWVLGVPGAHYAMAPFTHINPDGSRFSDGDFGVLYLADSMNTALAEVKHHQATYWKNIPELKYENFVFRGLKCDFTSDNLADITHFERSHRVLHPEDYSDARTFAQQLKRDCFSGIQYPSVRHQGSVCWGLFTPKGVRSIIQTCHFEFTVINSMLNGIKTIRGV